MHSTSLQLMKWRMMCTLHSMVMRTLLGSKAHRSMMQITK